MSQPRTKRQFTGATRNPAQRQITSFFNADGRIQSTAPAVSSHEARGTGHGIGPSLPSSVQSSLLSVGMRVRKSVPEGYKTGSAYSGYKMWSENSSAPGKPTTQSTNQNVYAYSNNNNNNNNNIGLVPYCGVNKIGGFSAQPIRIEDNSAPTDLPGLSSSQETVGDYEEEEEPRHSKKRGYVPEDDFEEFPGFDVSGIKEASRGPEVKIVYPDRVMAVPRKGRQAASGEVYDFDEAPFLDYSTLE